MVVGAILLIFSIAALIPAAQKIIPPQKTICQPVSLNGVFHNNYLVYGEVLYPVINKDRFSFSLLTCRRVLSFEITGFNGKLDIGQRIIAGLSDDSQFPRLEFIALPPDAANSAQVLWQGESK